jgi:hypothetical protein
MRHYFLSLIFVVLLSGCGTMLFTPTEYTLKDGLIPSLSIAGTVTVSNAQPSSNEVIVYSYGGSKLGSDLKTITGVMVQQTQKELQKNGNKTGENSQKTIALKVNSLLSEYTGAFYWKSSIKFEATLGNGRTINFKVPHTSGVLAQDLNGCIAEGVLVLLKDERVREYLAN